MGYDAQQAITTTMLTKGKKPNLITVINAPHPSSFSLKCNSSTARALLVLCSRTAVTAETQPLGLVLEKHQRSICIHALRRAELCRLIHRCQVQTQRQHRVHEENAGPESGEGRHSH